MEQFTRRSPVVCSAGSDSTSEPFEPSRPGVHRHISSLARVSRGHRRRHQARLKKPLSKRRIVESGAKIRTLTSPNSVTISIILFGLSKVTTGVGVKSLMLMVNAASGVATSSTETIAEHNWATLTSKSFTIYPFPQSDKKKFLRDLRFRIRLNVLNTFCNLVILEDLGDCYLG